jgi:hypothetical protein
MRLSQLTICTAMLLAILSIVTPAGAAGYWNLPGTFCQCMGVGWGAGYHAPLVLGPIDYHHWCDHNEVRLPYSPASMGGCYGYGGCGCLDCQPSRLEPNVLPAARSTPMPVPVKAVFAPPIER